MLVALCLLLGFSISVVLLVLFYMEDDDEEGKSLGEPNFDPEIAHTDLS